VPIFLRVQKLQERESIFITNGLQPEVTGITFPLHGNAHSKNLLPNNQRRRALKNWKEKCRKLQFSDRMLQFTIEEIIVAENLNFCLKFS